MIDFRRNAPQECQGDTYTYAGRCIVSGTRLYDCNGSNDPRGPLGYHAIARLVASEYSMSGPDQLVSWIVINNNRTAYDSALTIAKSRWSND